ncbi:MAG: molybdopterin converting factor, subunit 1 [Planctomycetota bacterium]|nr:molybdopterin converting factor, subunit 1 [Planctomycetota bacterium]
MRIEVRLFAVARQRVGSPTLTIDLPELATVADLRHALAASAPSLADLLPKLMIAVDSEYADDDRKLSTYSEVAVIPPVSGGSCG